MPNLKDKLAGVEPIGKPVAKKKRASRKKKAANVTSNKESK